MAKWTRAKLLGKVKESIVEIMSDTDIDEITEDSSLGDDLNADSLEQVEILMVIEENLGLDVADEDAEKWKSVKDIIDFLEENEHKIQVEG